MTSHKSFSARADIEGILSARGAQRIDVPALQPADPFLDMAGEELRRRIFLTQDQSGAHMCLRPEFTIPVCLDHIAHKAAPKRYGYVGTVFRQNPNGFSEFLQAGIENIGNADTTAADAQSLADCLACLHALNMRDSINTLIGDQALFDAVLAALGLPAGWRIRLTHAFGDDAALDTALARLSQPVTLPELPEPIMQALETGDAQGAEHHIAQAMDKASLTNAGGRTAQEISNRLMAKIAQSKQVPDAEKSDRLKQFLKISAPLDEAVVALNDFANQAGLSLKPAIKSFEQRNKALEGSGLDISQMTYSASFGRTLDYYTGLVYELRSADGQVLAGGGRYDRLLSLLGARDATPSVGFSLWLDRIAEARS